MASGADALEGASLHPNELGTVPRWMPAVVFAALTIAHVLVLPTFEGMDEPAHLSSILHFAAGRGRPVPGAARLHRSIEEAISFVPGPYHQWTNARESGGLSYAEWRRLGQDEQKRRAAALASLRVDTWQDGGLENWQAQHPPLYYAIVGAVVRAAGVSRFVSAHRLARLVSGAMFAMTGFLLTAFITGRWGASPAATLFVCLLPMWYVVGGRITNDALAVPTFGLALLIAIDQMRQPPSDWRTSAWLAAGTAAAVGLAAKAYALAFAPVAVAAALLSARQVLLGRCPRRAMLLPLAAVLIMVAANGCWLADNLARTGWVTGQNENVSLAARGIRSLSDRVPYVSRLVIDEPRQLFSAMIRGGGQALYVSNWTLGAAPPLFYALQFACLGLMVLPSSRHRARPSPATLRAAVLVSAIALVTIGLGVLKSVLDYFILFGEARLAQGWYVWGAGTAFAAALALAFDTKSTFTQRVAILLQAACLVTAFATDAMFWSGLYERHPVWRMPVRVSKQDAPERPSVPRPGLAPEARSLKPVKKPSGPRS